MELINAMNGNNMTYLPYTAKYIKQENSFLVDIHPISASLNSISHKYYTIYQSRCCLQVSGIQVDIKASVKQTEIDSMQCSYSKSVCALRLVVVLVYAGRAIDGRTWPFSHRIFFSRVPICHSAEKICSALSGTDISTKKKYQGVPCGYLSGI